jgi:hypothetical protein
VIADEALGALQQFEDIAIELPIVQKLGLIRAAEARQTQLALRIVQRQALLPSEQHDCGAKMNPIPRQSQAAQDIPRIALRRSLK